jgi:hypothetical protein
MSGTETEMLTVRAIHRKRVHGKKLSLRRLVTVGRIRVDWTEPLCTGRPGRGVGDFAATLRYS